MKIGMSRGVRERGEMEEMGWKGIGGAGGVMDDEVEEEGGAEGWVYICMGYNLSMIRRVGGGIERVDIG